MIQQHTQSIAIAEYELAAFMTAVAERHGPAQALHSAQDWLDELQQSLNNPSDGTFRSITIAAAIRLASRLNSASIGAKALPIPSSNCSDRPPLA
jgi:hypothetical protein